MEKKIKDLFGVPAPDHAVIKVRDNSSGPVPAVGDYVFDALVLKKVLLWLGNQTPRRNLFIIGQAGVGKTSFILEAAGRLNIPVWGISCSGKTRFEHLVGTLALVNGATEWVDGPLTAAMRSGGIFLANEISRMDPGEQMRLVDVLDSRARLAIPETGEIVEPGQTFRFAATGNSGGFGDESGAYAGERSGSLAFYDRFIKIVMKPLSEAEETALLKSQVPALTDTIVATMVRLAKEIRGGFVGNGGALRVNLSPRALLDWGKLMEEYRAFSGVDPIRESLMDTVLNGAPEDDAKVVINLLDKWLQP